MANLLCGKWLIAHTFSACRKGVAPAETVCLPNYLRVEKYLFTRKEIFTYTLKKNYLHVSNLSMCCFCKIKYWGKPSKGVIYNVPESDKYNAKLEKIKLQSTKEMFPSL